MDTPSTYLKDNFSRLLDLRFAYHEIMNQLQTHIEIISKEIQQTHPADFEGTFSSKQSSANDAIEIRAKCQLKGFQYFDNYFLGIYFSPKYSNGNRNYYVFYCYSCISVKNSMGDDDNIYKDFESHFIRSEKITRTRNQDCRYWEGWEFILRKDDSYNTGTLVHVPATLDEIKRDLLTLDKEMFQLINSFSKSRKK